MRAFFSQAMGSRRAGHLAGIALAALALAGCGGHGTSHGGTVTLGASKPVAVEVGQNVARVPGLAPGDVAAAAVLAAYNNSTPPTGWVLVPAKSWQTAIIGAQFAAKPVAAGLLPIEHSYVPTGPDDVLARLHVRGFPKAKGLQSLVLGGATTDVFGDLQDLGLKQTQLKAASPAQLAGAVVPFRGGWAHVYSDDVVIVSSDEAARDYALPAAAWSAYSGDTIAFVSHRGVPSATVKLLIQRKGLRLEQPHIYIAAPPSVVPQSVAAKLAQYGPVKRIPGQTPIDMAIALARYKDRATGFGWGLTRGPVSVSIVDERHWGDTLGALTFAAAGPQAPLLLTDGPDLPPAVVRYLQTLRGAQANQGFVFGDASHVPSSAVGRLDGLLAPAH